MITIVEIKSSIEDFRADAKWRDYCLHSDHFYFATGPHVPAGDLSARGGADRRGHLGAEILRLSACTITGGAAKGDAGPHRRAPARTGCTTLKIRVHPK